MLWPLPPAPATVPPAPATVPLAPPAPPAEKGVAFGTGKSQWFYEKRRSLWKGKI